MDTITDSPQPSFTPRAQKVIDFARAKAHSENRREASVSDIAFGLLDLGGGVAFVFLHNSKIDPPALAAELEKTPDSDPWTVLIESASAEAKRLSHGYIGTQHLLLALLRHPSNALIRALANLAINPETLRHEILKDLDPDFKPNT